LGVLTGFPLYLFFVIIEMSLSVNKSISHQKRDYFIRTSFRNDAYLKIKKKDAISILNATCLV